MASDMFAAQTDDSAPAYLRFALVDLAFPLLGAMLLATVAAACVRSASPARYARWLASGAFLVFGVPALLDWTENVFATWLVVAGEPASAFAVGGLVVAKAGKLLALTVAQVLCAAAILWWLVALVRRRRTG